MSSYTVSARKYRPATFKSVVGQEALTTTLKNAIASGKLANSYLFCGPRGVGKTTCARLFAKTINCMHPEPDGEACGECESCKTFNAELRSYNVFELDAASNNSVEDIRSLTEQVRIPPISGKYKVYIIDEVHMLSSAAFNAFLKTLEEPPAYAIFILATTEKHKVIPTILSRCQIYDFNRIGNRDIIAHLKDVASREGIETDDDALGVIAEKADGGLRDALSIFDQVTSFTEGHVTYERTISNLNVIDSSHYFRMTDLMLENRIPESLLLLNDIMSHGFDPSHLISGLLLHFRNLLVSRDACTLPLLEMSDEMRERYHTQAMKCQPKFLYKAMRLSNDCDINYRSSRNKRLLVELTLIRISQSATGEDDDSDGPGPKDALKPIFSKQTQPSITPAKPVQTDARPATAGNKPSSPKETPAPEQPKIPKVTVEALFSSIRGNKSDNKAGTESVVKDSTTDQKESGKDSRQGLPLNQERLETYWKEYALSLSAENTPLLNRMMNSTPTVVSDTEFSVTVMNQMAADDFNTHSAAITGYLREKLSNGMISMSVNIDKSKSDTRILSKAEQFNEMQKSNPALATLTRNLNLELV
ncbi:MAG: DNA polymerase III subunit gamma/tau [Bacteroidaceae bacterium]|nr:DNA polymerase III subunit gamma/tau [Bacteroidaceae bacterium]